ncbi:MAG: ATP-binding protein, partial [Myxococcota bacterium]
MTARLAQLELHLPGLLKLLGEHLYSDRRVAFRELVQNAHDSCVRRRLEDPSAPESRVSIRLEERDGRAWVCFDDNGLGLTDGEIERFLSTIGRGQTGAIKQELGAARTEELVGQFGVGLLSAFLIGDRVVVTTRRVGEPQGWQWICDGQQTYRLEEKDVASEGTSVAVRLRDDARDLASPARVREAVRHYAGWLETPIAIDGSPLSTRALPWSDQLSRITPLELATSLCDDRPPLAVVELAPFEDPELGTVPLHGLLAIPEGSQLSVREYGRATVLIRRMLVDPRAEGLLPRWARFVTGMIDCARLEPTASRETVRHERVFAAVRDAIEVQLTEALQRIADEEPQRWQRIIDAHAALLKRWALDSAV